MTSVSSEGLAEGRSKRSSRWRVTIVRLSDGARAAVVQSYPVIRSLDLSDLPVVVRTTGDRTAAEETAMGLRSLGAVVLISKEPASLEVSAYCARHRSRFAMHMCLRCSKPICEVCVELSTGERYCRECASAELSPRRRTRLRQLFMLFLFSVFIYFVVDYLQTEQEGTDPDGLVRVGVLQFVPPDHVGADILQTLNGMDRRRSEGTSLYDIAPWYNKERARFGGTSMPYLQTEILGPWAEELKPPGLADSGDGLLAGLYGAWSYSRYFTSMASRLGVDLDAYGVRVFLVYQTGSIDLASHSRGSQKGHLAVPYVGVEESNPAYGVVTVAHEIGHALGADDSYDMASGHAVYPGGFVDPFVEGIYPQRYAELMSPDIPEAPGTEREVSSLYQVQIGHQTASQLRWISPEEAEAFYSGPSGNDAVSTGGTPRD